MSKARASRSSKLWVVVRPRSAKYVLEDVLFKAGANDMVLLYKGGLDPHDVVGFFQSKRVAEKKAKALLKAVRR